MVALASLAWLLLAPAALPRAGYLHNHPAVRWNTLETEHFSIHWPASRRAQDDPHYFTTAHTAGQLARIAEQLWAPVCARVGHFLQEPIHIVVYDQGPGWQGAAYAVAEWDWIGVAADWGSTYRQRGRSQFLEDSLAHELSHIVSLKAYLALSEGSTQLQLGGLADDESLWRRAGARPPARLGADVGFHLPFGAHAPFWWVEGTAELWSEQAGVNRWSSARDAFLRSTVLGGRLLEPHEWTTQIDKRGFDTERSYNQGYAFGRYLAERFGEDICARCAKIAAQRWRGSWEAVLHEATGVPMEALYTDWKVQLLLRYQGQAAALRARGLVVGRELALVEPPWERAHDPTWEALSEKRRHAIMDGRSAIQELPSYSPDGRFMAWFHRGLNIREIRPEAWGAVGGGYVDEDDRRLLRHYERRTSYADFVEYHRVGWAPDGRRFVATGREHLPGSFRRLQGLSFDADGYNWTQLVIGEVHADGRQLQVTYRQVPNTLRAREAAWSPDGQSLAFVRYGDGTHNLWTIRTDGSGARRITAFADGTQLQGLSFLPGGEQLLVSIYRQRQQDLYLADLADGALTRLTDSEACETDPVVGPEGRVWFTSDADGIYNVYSLELDSGTVRKQTELIGGAYGAFVAPGGHLFYTALTDHGFRIAAMPAEGLLQRRTDYPGLLTVPETQVMPGATLDGSALDRLRAALLGVTRQPAPLPTTLQAAADSQRYRAGRAMLPFSGWPLLRASGEGLGLGASFTAGDYGETHWLEAEASFGQDNLLGLSYRLDRFWPSLELGGSSQGYKGVLESTLADGSSGALKYERRLDQLWAAVSTHLSPVWQLGLGADAQRYGYRSSEGGSAQQPCSAHLGLGPFVQWSPGSDRIDGEQRINPRGQRSLRLDYQYRLTQPLAGELVDSQGSAWERYGFHRVQASYSEHIPLGWFGLSEHHSLQLDVEGGFIDRHVLSWDGFAAGGVHPHHWGSGTIGQTVPFSGYEGWSLNGETLALARLAYRFPLLRDMNAALGPIYAESIYLQLFGSVGNLWGYRDDEGWRELPFRDYASANSPAGQQNRWLSDAGFELRLRSFIWNDWDWDSFLRLAYGFQSAVAYELGEEQARRVLGVEAAGGEGNEEPSWRVYLGIGTGW